MKSRLLAMALAWLSAMPCLCRADDPGGFPSAAPEKLPRWRGFNLTDKFHRDWSNGPFQESDFRWIHDFGFNFVLLPMDYRIWIEGDDWNRFREEPLREIDEAVDWGKKYRIHVSLNFHRAPGYTVANPREAKSLWTDADAQRACAAHWAMFARRYRDIPSARLSFNLFNEPSGVEEQVYVEVVRKIVAAIRAEDADRLIISDGLGYGQRPVLALAELKLAQATRGYTPSDVSHHQASWVGGTKHDPTPAWPRPRAIGWLYAPTKKEVPADARLPLRIDGPFTEGASLRLRVATVSSRARLVVRGDSRTLLDKQFVCGPGEGEWQKAVFMPEWNIYQNVYNRDYEAALPPGVARVEIAVVSGDWLRLGELGITRPGAQEDVLSLRSEWGQKPAHARYTPGGAGGPFLCETREDRQWLWRTRIVPWLEAERAGIGVIVGEFGCFNKTPHDVALRWLEDSLANWRKCGWGWALWNFRGSFGILDSGRDDVDYEDFHGHKLDRKMLELLQRN